jgi:hypothetical protein
MPDDALPPPPPHPRTSPLLLIVAWLVVGIPAAWGVSQTVMRSLDLFKSPPPPATAAPAQQ